MADPLQDMLANLPAQGQNPGMEALGNQMQQPSAPTQQPGAIRSLLSNFFTGAGEAMTHSVGLPTEQEKQQLQIKNQLAQRQQAVSEQVAQTQEDWKQIQGDALKRESEGSPIPESFANAIGHPELAGTPMNKAAMGLAGKVFPSQNAAAAKENVATINQGGAFAIPVDHSTATILGMPELEGQKLGKASWGMVNTALNAKGYHVIDTGANGPQGGMWVIDKAGNKISQVSPNSVAVSRGASSANARAAVTPFQTFDSEGNLVTTSALNAVQSGAPSATAYNSLYGPTGSTKTQGQAAGAVLSHIPAFLASVDKLAARGELGAVQGRLNEYLNSGYGGNDPDIAEYVATAGLIKSGAVRAHFGAKGGAQVLNKFDRMLNTSQEPGAIHGAANAISSFLNTYKNTGTLQGPKTSIPAVGQSSGGGNVVEYVRGADGKLHKK